KKISIFNLKEEFNSKKCNVFQSLVSVENNTIKNSEGTVDITVACVPNLLCGLAAPCYVSRILQQEPSNHWAKKK
ncbi:unnamed protein product, partial [Porites evermanni]